MLTLHHGTNPSTTTSKRTQSELKRYGQIWAIGVGEELYEEGDEADGIYCLVSGGVKLPRRVDGNREFILDLVRPGTTFGEEGAVAGRRRLSGAKALTRSRVIHLPRADLARAIHSSPQLAVELVELLSRRQGALFERMLELTWPEPADRIASAHERLLDLMEASADGAPVDAADVAAHALTSPQAVRACLTPSVSTPKGPVATWAIP